MITKDSVIELVRAADPLDPQELEAWPEELTARLVLDRAIGAPAKAVVRRPRLIPLAVGVLVASAGTVGVAVATGVLGGPAPDPVKAHLAELDRGIPADLRYNADVEHARAVATTGSGALYLADLHGGGYCLEAASPDARPRGASCVPAAQLSGLPLDVIAPIPEDSDAPLLVGGRANSPLIVRIVARYADGSVGAVPFGLERTWLFEVPDAERASALASGVVVLGLDASGSTVTSVDVPALRDDDPLGTAHDTTEPLVLTTTSDGSDFRQVLGIQGRVNLTGTIRLEVRFPDGARLAVPLASDGTYSVVFTAARRDDFATTPGVLVALREGFVVASRPIESVAVARARNG